MKKILSNLFLLYLVGWKIKGNRNLCRDKIKKAVLISAPHTHWLDLFLGLLVKGSIGFKSNFLAKKELFVFPISLFLRFWGGIPVDRSSKNNLVQQIVNIFDNKKEFRISLSPEGTRQKVEKFKTGFYFIAKAAKVPIIMITMDYENKTSLISEPFYPSDNKEKDFIHIEKFFTGVVGKIKENSFRVD